MRMLWGGLSGLLFVLFAPVALAEHEDSHQTSQQTTQQPSTSRGLSVSPISLTLAPGESGLVTVSGGSSKTTVSSQNTKVATGVYKDGKVAVRAGQAGTARMTVKDGSRLAAFTVTVQGTAVSTSKRYALLAWNDLGMHCVDGKDFSVFSILPPFNNLHAQLVDTSSNQVVRQGVTLTYESLADPTGSINTHSSDKTNFWQYVQALFHASPAPEMGLAGNPMSSRTPHPLTYVAANDWYEAAGIPITPYDDAGKKNFYPMVKVVAKDTKGTVLASARTVLPVSDEMNCKACHASNTATGGPTAAAKPAAGWVFDTDPEKDWKKNILKLHDEKKLTDAAYRNAITVAGYDPAGLFATAQKGKPVLCAACHGSNALPGTGVTGISPLTSAVHTLHGTVQDPVTGKKLDDVTNRETCYKCHPGAVTQCLRGAMSAAVDAQGLPAINCQSCHGSMHAVGNPARTGWLQQPNCQACHHDGKRELTGVDVNGKPLSWTDARFATNANTPASGFSLFRFSKGHGSLQCESCHGATHAEYPSTHDNDNLLAIDLQGHKGTVAECTACHTTVPFTANGGPHGMHTTGNQWVSKHGDLAEKSGTTACAYCHGADYRGTPLSQIKMNKTFSVEGRNKSFAAGTNVGCYDCHNGPRGD